MRVVGGSTGVGRGWGIQRRGGRCVGAQVMGLQDSGPRGLKPGDWEVEVGLPGTPMAVRMVLL